MAKHKSQRGKHGDTSRHATHRRAEPPAEGQPEKEAKKESEPRQDGIPMLEWVVATIGLILVAGAIGLVLYEALRKFPSPPDVMVHVDAIAPTGSGYLVKFRAVNQGGSTASGVIIEGEVTNGDEEIEKGQMTFDYLPSGSEREGGLFFTDDPRQFDFKIRALGYQEPQ